MGKSGEDCVNTSEEALNNKHLLALAYQTFVCVFNAGVFFTDDTLHFTLFIARCNNDELRCWRLCLHSPFLVLSSKRCFSSHYAKPSSPSSTIS